MDIRDLVEVDREKMSGTPVFNGTRVPIKNLFDYLEGGDSLDVFLNDFPTVTREQALGVLEESKRTLLAEHEADGAELNAKLAAIQEAVTDEMFLADLREAMEDF